MQDSWLWRMHATMPATDLTHHQFWQRLLRWVVDGVPGVVEVSSSPERVEPREPVTLTAQVGDKKYTDVNDARVVATVRSPTGIVSDVPMSWSVKRDGEYQAVDQGASFVVSNHAHSIADRRLVRQLASGFVHQMPEGLLAEVPRQLFESRLLFVGKLSVEADEQSQQPLSLIHI